MNYAGGRRYTPIDLPASIMTNEQVLYNTQIILVNNTSLIFVQTLN